MVTWDVHHPLLGVAPPALAGLLERADDRARAVLDAARRLRRRRSIVQAEAHAQLDRSFGEPWGEPYPRSWSPPPVLLEGDLLRALLVMEPELLLQPLRDDLRPEVSAAATERWAAELRDAPPPEPDDALDAAWARRWALADERHRAPTIDVEYLVASLGNRGLRALAPFSSFYAEGLVTEPETVNLYLSHSAARVEERAFEDVPAAYLDRGDHLHALGRLLEREDGVLLVGPPRSGRSALLKAWLEATANAGHAWIDPHLLQPGRAVEQVEPPSEPTLVCFTAPRTTEGRAAELLAQGFGFDSTDLATRRDEWLVAQRAGLEPGGPWRPIVVLEPLELQRLRRTLPVLDRFGVLELAAPEPLELAMIWLAHTMPLPELGVANVLAALHHLGLDTAGRIDPWALEQAVEIPALRSSLDPLAARQGMVHRPTRTLVERALRGEPLGERSRYGIVGRVGGEAGVRALLELEERLYGPRVQP